MINKTIEVICNMPERRDILGIIVSVNCDDSPISISIQLSEDCCYKPDEPSFKKGSIVKVSIDQIKICLDFNGKRLAQKELVDLVSTHCQQNQI